MQSSSTKRSVPDSPVNFGESPPKVPAVITPWPVTVRVHSKGQYSMLVELLFVPDKTDSKALRYALLRYCGGCMHLIFALAPCFLAGSSRSWMLKPSSTGGIFCDQQVSWQVKQFSASGGDALCLSKVRLLKIVAALGPRQHPRLSEAANFFAHNCQFWLRANMIRG